MALVIQVVIKAIYGEEYTQLAGLFVHFLRCKKRFIACYAPFYALKMNKNPEQSGYIHSWKSLKFFF